MSAKDSRICFVCVNEEFLRALIERGAFNACCSYCGQTRATMSTQDLAEKIDVAFKAHYYQTPEDPSEYDYEIRKSGGNDGERRGDPVADVIAEAAGICEQAAIDVQSLLAERYCDVDTIRMGDECPFAEDSYYAKKVIDDGRLQAAWLEFKEALKNAHDISTPMLRRL